MAERLNSKHSRIPLDHEVLVNAKLLAGLDQKYSCKNEHLTSLIILASLCFAASTIIRYLKQQYSDAWHFLWLDSIFLYTS